MMKKRYISPVTNIVQMYELEHSVLVGSVMKMKMKVDPLQEKYYDETDDATSDYLIEL